MPDAVISVENLGKRYRLGQTTSRRETHDARTELWALKDVTFDVQRGEVLGIIGRNGAGKSTLLKILSRITDPSEGRAVLRGRVNSLLEVGTGFHPELTGRENIFMNAAMHGMRRSEIARRLDEIVAFAEVERFIDTPVKRYSSGMYTRLAFAVAAHLEPEILIVDEVLAVGDVRFQKKCLERMDGVAAEGKTVLFVSHNMPAVLRLCRGAILLDRGGLVIHSGVAAVVQEYLKGGSGSPARNEWPDDDSAPGDDVVRLRSLRVRDEGGTMREAVDISSAFGIELVFDVLKQGVVLVPGIRVVNQEGVVVFQANDWEEMARRPGRYCSAVHVPRDLLNEGTYYISVGIATPSPVIKRLFVRDAAAFQIVDSQRMEGARSMWGGDLPGIIRPELRWETTVVSL